MQNNTEDTIDLRELFLVLKKRKKMIWGVTTLLTLSALAYVFIAKPVYQVKTMIEVGQIDAKPIDNVNDIKEKLSYEYQLNAKGKEIELPRVASISVPKGSNNILSMDIHGNSNDDAVKYIQTVIQKIETDYKEKTDAYTNSQKQLIKLIKSDIKDNTESLKKMEEALQTYNQKIITLESEDAALAGIYALQISQNQLQIQEIKVYISNLKNKEQALKLSMTPLKIKPTHQAGEIETLEKPIKPKKTLIVVVSFITGLMLSIFLAFFLEFVSGVKKEED